MARKDNPAATAILADARSQLLCLADAHRSGYGPALAHALRAVAHARGLERLAKDAGITAKAMQLLVDQAAGGGDASMLAEVLRRLGERSAKAARSLPSAKTTKDRRARDKT